MDTIKSNKHAWWIFYNKALDHKSFWENPAPDRRGLLLAECPKCKARQTRETYVDGFFINFYTLVQSYEVTGIAQCKTCGQWIKISG